MSGDTARWKMLLKDKARAVGSFSKLFSFFDRDGSGRLEVKEFFNLIRRDLGLSLRLVPDSAVIAVFSDVDSDHDGSIDLDEFLSWVGVSSEQDGRNELA